MSHQRSEPLPVPGLHPLRSLDAALNYAKERQRLGQPIAAFQGIQFMLTGMAMQTHAARLMVHHAARQVDAGIRGNTYEASMNQIQHPIIAEALLEGR